jgi:hypothetical protein
MRHSLLPHLVLSVLVGLPVAALAVPPGPTGDPSLPVVAQDDLSIDISKRVAH